MVRGAPGRGSSASPSSRLARNRDRHLVTVPRATPSRAATAISGPPSAQASTIRARNASPCAVLRRFAQFSNVRRSASDSTSGSSLLSPIPPAHPANWPTGTPVTRTRDARDKSASCGAVTTQDRLTRFRPDGTPPQTAIALSLIQIRCVVRTDTRRRRGPGQTHSGDMPCWAGASDSLRARLRPYAGRQAGSRARS
jgi:hypothetical protein